MWTRKEIKRNARKAFRKNYWCIIAICFIMAIVVGKYSLSTSIIYQYDESEELKTDHVVDEEVIHNTEIVNDFLYATSDGTTNILLEQAPQATKGVLGTLFNNSYQSRSFLFGLLNSVNQIFFSDKIGAGIVILIGAILSILFLIFVANIFKVCECRFFLENRLYPKTSINRILFLYKLRKIWNPAKIMFCRSVYLGLWFITIIGGFIKLYSYHMVPYILAENPLTPRKEAFALSRQMMQGNKWRTFILDLSFWYWYVLEIFTFGLAGLFFLNGYVAAVNAELYMSLRKEAIDSKIKYYENFKDKYLESPPQIGESLRSPGALQYPIELYIIPEPKPAKIFTIDYNKTYTVKTLIILFFIFSFLGWGWEVGLHLFKEGHFVNRGFLIGPYLPIYGTGGVLMLILLKKVRNRPVLTFFLIMVICAVIEYFTSYFMEQIYQVKWWDYSGYLLNLNGRICLEGTVFFGIGGCLIIYVLAPLLNNFIEKINKRTQIALCLVLLSVFIADFSHSAVHPNTGEGITQSQENITWSLKI